MEKVKRLFMITPGEETADHRHLMPGTIEDVINNGIPDINDVGINRVHIGPECEKSRDTAYAFLEYAEKTGNPIKSPTLPEDKRLGCLDLFDQIFNDEMLKKANEKGITFFSALKTTWEPYDYFPLMEKVGQAVLDAFDLLNEGDVCLLIGHRPFIQIAADFFCKNQLDDWNLDIDYSGVEFIKIDGNVYLRGFVPEY